MPLQHHFWNLSQTWSCRCQGFKPASAMQAMQVGLAQPCCPSPAPWQAARWLLVLPVLRGSWAERGWPGTPAHPVVRGDNGAVLVLLTFSPRGVAQGFPWGLGKLCLVRRGPSAFLAVWALRGNSHMGQLHPHLPRSVLQHLQGLGRQWGHVGGLQEMGSHPAEEVGWHVPSTLPRSSTGTGGAGTVLKLWERDPNSTCVPAGGVGVWSQGPPQPSPGSVT